VPELPLPSRPLLNDDIALRPWREEDASALAALCREDSIIRWTRVPSNYREEDARAHIRRAEDERRAGHAVYFAVADVTSDELLGACDLRVSRADAGVAEVAFLLGAHVRGRGVMTQAVRLIARWGMEELDLVRIELLTHPENQASARVAELAGFTREGLLRAYREKHGKREDRVLFSLLPEDLK
jgi:RimJ/RimL family protein N-acetyltransferase